MEITGRIIWISPEKRGVSKTTGREWKARDYVIECKAEGAIVNFIYNLFGDINDEHQNSLGTLVTVSYTVGAKEWNGRWYGENKAYKTIACEGNGQVAAWQRLDYAKDLPSGMSASDREELDAWARNEIKGFYGIKTESPATYDEAAPYAQKQVRQEQPKPAKVQQPTTEYDDLPF